MGKILSQLINRFDGGMILDKRLEVSNGFALSRHFDTKTYPRKLVPRNNTEFAGLDETAIKALNITRFLYGERSAGVYKVFGLGQTPTGKTSIYYWSGTGWAQYNNMESSTGGAESDEVFFLYKGFIYCFAGGKLQKIDITSNVGFDEEYEITSSTTRVQPVLHPADDCAYFFVDNLVYQLNDTVWASGLTLPANMEITSACPEGNYLSIACYDKENKKSTVFRWDRDSSLTTLSDRVDFGTGRIEHLACLNNKLTAVVSNQPNVFIKQVSGNVGIIVEQLISSATSLLTFEKTSQVIDEILYFPMDLDYLDDEKMGIYSVNSNGKISIDFIVDGATSYQGIFNVNNAWWIGHSNNGSIAKETAIPSSTMACTYDTLILGNALQNKKLNKVGLLFEPSNETLNDKAILKYRLREADNWIQILTYTRDNISKNNIVFYDAVNIESTGETLPEYREIIFRIESYANMRITGFYYEYEILDTDL